MVNEENISVISNDNNNPISNSIFGMGNNMVIARVWKPKNKQGQVVSVLEAIRTDGSVGHVSLQIFIQGQQKLYVSFWPSVEVDRPFQEVDAMMHTIEADIREERSVPDTLCYLVNLDGQKIMKAFFDYLHETNSHPRYTLLPIANQVLRTVLFNTANSHNCCTMTLRLVEAGLITLGTRDDIVRTQIDEMKKSNKDLDPHLLSQFFENFSRHEEQVFENKKLKEYKSQFIQQIKQTLEKLADSGLAGDLLLYQRIYPEIYQSMEREIYAKVQKAYVQIRQQFQQLADAGDLAKLEKLKQDYPQLYADLKADIAKRLKEAYARLGRENTDAIIAATEKRKAEAIAILQAEAKKFLIALKETLKNRSDLDSQAYKTFGTTLLNVLRKGKINELMNKPENFGIPQDVVPFIFDYLYTHPALVIGGEYPEDTKTLEVSYLNTPSSFWQAPPSSTTITSETALLTASSESIALCRAVIEAHQMLALELENVDSEINAQSLMANLLNAVRHNQLTDFLAHPDHYSVPLSIPNIRNTLNQLMELFPNLKLAESLKDEAKALEVKLNCNELVEIAQQIESLTTALGQG